MYKIQGKIITVKPVQTISVSKGEFKKQNFIVKVDEKFDNFMEFVLTGKRIEENNLEEGARVEVGFFINGKEWKDKIIHNLNAIEIEKLSGYETETDISYSSVDGVEDEPKQKEDDLPF
tara:strand:- start:1 stop:357 length:357 start_codon:yes stop_codon:yes gene_type:complete